MKSAIGTLVYWLMVASPRFMRVSRIMGYPNTVRETIWMKYLWKIAFWSMK